MEESSQALDQILIQEELSDPELNLAGSGKRFLNMIIDVICYYLSLTVIIIALVGFGLTIDPEDKVTLYLLCFSIHFLYHTSFEAIWGKTIGKMLTKSKVVNMSGGKITFSEAAGRSLSRFIPFEAFTFLGSSPGLHDRLSKTRVING